ncbi:MAG: FadR/GntR family transcriptional regulator [Lachnospiraceae bacterium]
MQSTGRGYLKKVNSESVVQLVINSLTDAMIERKLCPGDKLPTESELAESLGVGRNSIREAIKILVYLGVLEIKRAEGTFVCEGFSESMIDPMIYGIILNTSDSYENLMELREMMEVGVMQIAMEKYTQEKLKNLKAILDQMKAEIKKGPENVEQVFKSDNDFHNAISIMGENPIIDKINRVVKTLTYSIRFNTVKVMLETGRGEELFEAHQKLFQIIVDRDKSDMGTTVRKTYFSKVGIQTIEE